jgi:methionine-rich copper-binding protein CopC
LPEPSSFEELKMRTFVLIAMLLFGLALAHSQLKSSNPKDGSTVRVAPKIIQLEFNEGIEYGFSTIRVIKLPVAVTIQDHYEANEAAERYLPKIKSAELEKIRVDTGIIPKTGQGKKVSIALKPLKAGWYGVIWRALGTDTHTVSGVMTFRVKP